MRSERDLLDRTYMLVGHALPAALQTEIKAALGITPPVLLDDIAKLISLARRTMWLALCWNDHNFDAANKYAKTEVDKAGFTNIERANAWLEKMEAALSVSTPSTVALVTSELAALRKLFERIDEETHPDNKCLPSGAAAYEFAANADRTVDHLRSIAQEGIRKVENLEYSLAGDE